MPPYVSRRLQDLLNNHSKAVRGSTVLLLGVTYKANISDRRESPSVPLAKKLLDIGCKLQYHDPYAENWVVNGIEVDRVNDLTTGLSQADAVIIVQAHRAYVDASDVIARIDTPILDTTGKFSGTNVERL
jgi:UDP-N-acetyl-D-glucosamine dehydrogenase